MIDMRLAVKWQFDALHHEWQLVDCDGGLLGIVGTNNDNWYFRGRPMLEEEAKYECLNSVLSGSCGDDIFRRAIKQPLL